MQLMDLNEILIFIKVVEAMSFSGAAKELGLPNSTVSTRVSSLENRLGLTLIQRTTRKLKLTSDGEFYYKSVVNNIEGLFAAEAELLDSGNQVKGNLKITAPVHLGHTLLPEILKNFQEKYPNVTIDLLLSDNTLDLITEGVDLAIRAGVLPDSSLVSKYLGVGYFVPYASKQYVKKFGRPELPQDISLHRCLVFSPLGKNEWAFSNGRSEQVVKLNPKFLANEVQIIKSMVLESQGIALLPTFSCFDEQQKGDLIRLLPGWNSHSRKIYFVYPAQKKVRKSLRAFIDLATPYLKELLKEREV